MKASYGVYFVSSKPYLCSTFVYFVYHWFMSIMSLLEEFDLDVKEFHCIYAFHNMIYFPLCGLTSGYPESSTIFCGSIWLWICWAPVGLIICSLVVFYLNFNYLCDACLLELVLFRQTSVFSKILEIDSHGWASGCLLCALWRKLTML